MCNCNKSSSSSKAAAPKASVTTSSLSRTSSFQSKRKKTQASVSSPALTTQTDDTDLENLSGETFADKCQTFAYVLGLENPVPEKVLIAALEDKSYADRLLMYRNDPYLYELLNNPPEGLSKKTTTENPSFSSAVLIAKAGKALLLWGLSGFPTVSSAILKKREDACLICPNLVDSTNVLQKFTASQKISDKVGDRTGNKSCSVCGCVVRNKMRLATDTCPQEVSTTPGLNRWEEPLLL